MVGHQTDRETKTDGCGHILDETRQDGNVERRSERLQLLLMTDGMAWCFSDRFSLVGFLF